MNDLSEFYPKVRQLDFQPITHEGERASLIRDPSEISTDQLVLPPVLARMTLYCDGLHDIPAIYEALEAELGGQLPKGALEHAIQTLDESFMLDNARFRDKQSSVTAEFRNAPYRPMALVDRNYCRDLAELDLQFKEYGRDDDPSDIESWSNWSGRGIVSPHIDYQRGGAVYAQTWARAHQAVADADLVLMFATDHKGGLGSLTLTEKAYETPYGILPTDLDVVRALEKSIGSQDAYRLELNHRNEHSVELSAVWLHHVAHQVRPNNPPPMVPLLIGSFQHFVMGQGHPAKDSKMMGFVDALKQATKGKRVLCVASVDLSHVGHVFGDDYIMDGAKRQTLVHTDTSLMEAVSLGDGERFYSEIASIEDRNKVCGFSPLYLMLKYMETTSGHPIAYQHCTADAQDHSLVSICGMLLD